MSYEQIAYAATGGVATITLRRPERMNAWTWRMGEELEAALDVVDGDDSVRAVVVTGAGRAFCAGADLEAGGATFERPDTLPISEYRDRGGRLTLRIHGCRKPVIAAINGAAVGIGITMTLAMDLRVVAEDAKVGFVFVRRGIVPEACSSWFLPRIVGIAKAAELVYTGRVFEARDEAHSGLFNYVVPRDSVLVRAQALAREIAENTSATSVALARAMLWHGLGEADPESAHLIDSKCMYWAGKQTDAKEGIQSFLEKRPARFQMSAAQDMPPFYPWWKTPRV